MYDGLDVITNQMPNFIKPIFRYLVRNKHKKVVLKLIEASHKKKLTIDWAISHGQYITGAKDPYEFFELLSKNRLEEVGHLITQDVLLLAGEEDHLIPLDHLEKTQKVLINVKSVTYKLFTKETGGEQHC